MGAMGPPPPPPALAPRALGPLVADSWELYKDALPQLAAAVAWGALPAALVSVASAALTGIESRETLKAAVEAGEFARVGAASSLGVAARVLGALGGLAAYPVLAGRASGTAVDSAQAYTYVVERLWPLVKTVLRQVVYILLGTLCLVIPGLVLAFRYALSQPAVMLEGLSGPEALARSREFMGRYPGKVVGNLAVAWLLTLAAVLAALFGVGLGVIAVELVLPKAVHPTLAAVQAVAGGYLDVLVSAWITAFMVLLYGDLMRANPRA